MKRLGLIASSTARVYGAYAVLALAVLAPLLGRGYIQTLDMVFTPHLRMPASVSSSYLFRALLRLANLVLPSDLIEKVLLFLILLLSAVGLHLLVRSLSVRKPDIAGQLGWYFGGILYMINPFTYDRFMAGQYDVLLGYALLPWFLRALLSLLARPALRPAVMLAVWALVISIVSIHTIGLMLILAVAALGCKAWQQRADSAWLRQMSKFGLVAAAIFVVASSYWLVPLALGHGSTATVIGSFSSSDQSAFSTLGGSAIGRFGNVSRLQGFWAEDRGLFVLPQEHVVVWGLLAMLVWALVITGGISYWRARQRGVVILFGMSALIAAIFAVGIFNNWLAGHIPLFAGYREPQKFVALIALAYAVLAGRGAAATVRYNRRQGGRYGLVAASVTLLLIPLAWTPTMLWGFDRQLEPSLYPPDWYTINQQLDNDPGQFSVLFLPWHLYMYYSFAGRIIASPAPQFFDKPMLVSNNPEFHGAAAVPNAADTAIGRLLARPASTTDLGAQLARYNVKYVLLARDDDYARYGWLDHQTQLQLIAKSATLDLYQNLAYRGH